MNKKELKLCYAKDRWAWFTTCPLSYQNGDDWNDSPYEWNAGEPYEWASYMQERDNIAPYKIVKVAWEGPYMLPCHEHLNSSFSVEKINRGDIAWFRPDYGTENLKPIHAGASLKDFITIIKNAGGRVYVEI